MSASAMIEGLKEHARRLEKDTFALYLTARHPGTVLAAGVATYAFSPIDLIPDFIPVLGYLDDLLVIPLGIAIVLRLVPPEIMDECRVRAEEQLGGDRQVSRTAGAIVTAVWAAIAALIGWVIWKMAVR